MRALLVARAERVVGRRAWLGVENANAGIGEMRRGAGTLVLEHGRFVEGGHWSDIGFSERMWRTCADTAGYRIIIPCAGNFGA